MRECFPQLSIPLSGEINFAILLMSVNYRLIDLQLPQWIIDKQTIPLINRETDVGVLVCKTGEITTQKT